MKIDEALQKRAIKTAMTLKPNKYISWCWMLQKQNGFDNLTDNKFMQLAKYVSLCLVLLFLRFFLLLFFSLVIRHASSREPKKKHPSSVYEWEWEKKYWKTFRPVAIPFSRYVYSLTSACFANPFDSTFDFHCPKIAVNCIDRLRINV